MPLSSEAIIVGGGATLTVPSTIGNIPMVIDPGPPGALSDSPLRVWDDGAVKVVTIGPTNVEPGTTETLRLAGGFISRGGTPGPTNTSLRMGAGATVNGGSGIAIGDGANANGNGVAIGNNSGDSYITIGHNSASTGRGIAIGNGAVANTVASGSDLAIAIGNGANARGNDVVIGLGASQNTSTAVASSWSVVIGAGATANAGTGQGQNVVIGGQATVVAAGGNRLNVVIGRGATINGANGVTIGQGTTGFAHGVVVGSGSSLANGVGIILGSGIANAGANEGYFGSVNTPIDTLYVGRGRQNTGAAAPLLIVASPSPPLDSVGFAGAPLTLRPGMGTSGAIDSGLGGVVRLQAARYVGFLDPTAPETVVEASIAYAGVTPVADSMGIMLYDVTAGTLVRVSRGAVDSGGVGFRQLVIPN